VLFAGVAVVVLAIYLSTRAYGQLASASRKPSLNFHGTEFA
jgi:hypothetical protein